MEPTELLPILSVISIVTVEYGGWALLTFVAGPRERLEGFQEQFFRAGHAHAGVLLILSLVYYIYLDRADLSETAQWIGGIVLLVGIMCQSGGFFVHMGVGEPNQPSLGTRLTRTGALLIGAALILLAVGLIKAL